MKQLVAIFVLILDKTTNFYEKYIDNPVGEFYKQVDSYLSHRHWFVNIPIVTLQVVIAFALILPTFPMMLWSSRRARIRREEVLENYSYHSLYSLNERSDVNWQKCGF